MIGMGVGKSKDSMRKENLALLLDSIAVSLGFCFLGKTGRL